MSYIYDYYRQIEDGNIVVGERVAKQYKRLKSEIEQPSGKYVYDDEKAQRPIEFIETFCKHSKGKWAGNKIELDLWQKAYISALYGFVDKDSGLRKYKESMLLVGRKNGKSTLLAGLGLYGLVGDGEGGAEINIVATKKDQAQLVFSEMHNMVKQSPLLRKHIRKRKSDLYFEPTLSKAQALGRNADSLDGLNSSVVVVDELHAIKDRELYEVMQQSQSAREQPLLLMITTAGTVRESIYDDMYEMATNIVDGIFEDEHFLPMLYELDDVEEWKDPKNWEKANPGLGTIKNIDDLERKVERAKQYPKEVSGLLTKDFNMKQTNSSAWLDYQTINNEDTFSLEGLETSYAIGGLDIGRVDDLSCATLLFVDNQGNKYVEQMYWIPEETLYKRVHEDKIPYDLWKSQGLIRTTPGNITDVRYIVDWFEEMRLERNITTVWLGYDPWQATNFKSMMEDLGYTTIPVRQGAKTQSTPMQVLEKDLEAKRVNYNNNPILKWNFTNAGVTVDKNGGMSLIKNATRKMKIDGVASLLNAYVILLDKEQDYKNMI